MLWFLQEFVSFFQGLAIISVPVPVERDHFITCLTGCMACDRTVARKFSIGGLCVTAEGLRVCAGRLGILKIIKNSTDL